MAYAIISFYETWAWITPPVLVVASICFLVGLWDAVRETYTPHAPHTAQSPIQQHRTNGVSTHEQVQNKGRETSHSRANTYVTTRGCAPRDVRQSRESRLYTDNSQEPRPIRIYAEPRCVPRNKYYQ